MVWSRVKNLLIAMLVAVNVFLLVVYGFTTWRENRDMEQVTRDLLSVADSLGVDLPEHLVQTAVQTLDPMQASVSREQDRAIAEALLGVCEETVREDDAVIYQSAAGSLLLYPGGELELELALTERIADEHGARKLAESIVKRLEQSGQSPVFEETSTGQDFLLTIPLTVSGLPVFDSVLTMEISADFVTVSGQRVLHNLRQLQLGDVQELPGVLLSLFGYWEERGLLSQTITEIELGYLVENRKAERLNILPVWHVGVEGGDWYVSALDGSILAP